MQEHFDTPPIVQQFPEVGFPDSGSSRLIDAMRWRRWRRLWERLRRPKPEGFPPLTAAGIEHARDKRLSTIQDIGELAITN